MSDLYKLKLVDLGKGLLSAVFGAAVLAFGSTLHDVIASSGFNLFTTDWATVLSQAVNMAVIGAEGAFSGYLVKNFFTDSNGAVLGRWGGNK